MKHNRGSHICIFSKFLNRTVEQKNSHEKRIQGSKHQRSLADSIAASKARFCKNGGRSRGVNFNVASPTGEAVKQLVSKALEHVHEAAKCYYWMSFSPAATPPFSITSSYTNHGYLQLAGGVKLHSHTPFSITSSWTNHGYLQLAGG